MQGAQTRACDGGDELLGWREETLTFVSTSGRLTGRTSAGRTSVRRTSLGGDPQRGGPRPVEPQRGEPNRGEPPPADLIGHANLIQRIRADTNAGMELFDEVSADLFVFVPFRTRT